MASDQLFRRASQQQVPTHVTALLLGSGKFRESPVHEALDVNPKDFLEPSEQTRLGRGSHNRYVYKTKLMRTGFEVALKRAPMKRDSHISYGVDNVPLDEQGWYRELKFLDNDKRRKHPHVVWLHCYIIEQTPPPNSSHNLLLYLELMDQSFKDILDRFTTNRSSPYSDTPFKRDNQICLPAVKAFLKQTTSALKHLHELGYMHRDVKPGNILFKLHRDKKEGIVKLADFDTIKKVVHDDTKFDSTGAGTNTYCAPETLENQTKYNAKCDMWMLGITTIELVQGLHPVVGFGCSASTSEGTAYSRKLDDKDQDFSVIPMKLGLEGSLCKMLGDCLKREPEERPTSSKVFELMCEEFKDEGDKIALFEDSWQSSLQGLCTSSYGVTVL